MPLPLAFAVLAKPLPLKPALLLSTLPSTPQKPLSFSCKSRLVVADPLELEEEVLELLELDEVELVLELVLLDELELVELELLELEELELEVLVSPSAIQLRIVAEESSPEP